MGKRSTRFYWIDRKITTGEIKLRRYIFQSGLACVVVFLILYTLHFTQYGIMVSVIGSSAFIVFTMPTYPSARPRNVIGGHLIGVLVGLFFSAISFFFSADLIFTIALSVGLVVLFMPIFDAEHPPAAATPLTILLEGDYRVAVFVLTSAVLLSLAKKLLTPWLKNVV